ncbi:MAG: GyrI-like domain-containing protein [Bacteroidota bacterium]
MEKLDLVKSFKEYYKAKQIPELVDLAPAYYLTISGVSAPEDELFVKSIESIYPLAYGIKKLAKDQGRDFGVPKMEGQWWVEGEVPFEETPRDQWHWRIMIMMPDFVDIKMVDKAREIVEKKKNPERLADVTFEKIHEGKSVQALHIGSYEEEKPTLEKLFKMIADKGLSINGYHHEIYLSDPRKTPEERLKTIIRYPVK